MPKNSTKKTTKKTAKKKSVKKTTKRTTKKTSKKTTRRTKRPTKAILRKKVRKNASPDKCFILVNGHKIKNIKELADIIDRIEDHVLHHHVTDDKNDFALWLKDVFEEVGLAEELAHVKDKKHMQLILYKHISHKLW